MAYSATNWVDGTTPVNATNLNKLEGGVADLSDAIDEITDTGILSKKIVSEATTNVYVINFSIDAGASREISSQTSMMVGFCVSTSEYGLYFVISTALVPFASSGSNVEVVRSGNTITITNNASRALRGVAIIN